MKDTERTFVLAGLVVFFLLIMHALPKLHIGATELRRVNILSDLVPEKDDDAGSIIPTPKAPKAETIAKTRSGKAIHFKEVWPKGVEPIVDYSGDAAGGMRHFYDALSRVKTMNRPVRIAYFGDSFIENDIMTADLRELFQKEFGGNGVGWVDLANPINRNSRRTVTQQTSGTREYAIVSKPFDKQRQGIGERYYSVANGAKVSTDAASTFNRFQPHSKTFDVARLFFRTDGSATIGAAIGKQPVRTRTFGPSGSVQMYEVKGHGSQLTYTFNGLSGTFTGFGMAMESNRGVILDCLSMRGSNGLTLKDIPQHTLNDFHRLRPYDLIIVQFGLNVAVAGNPQKIIKLYATHMRQVITHLRQSFPDASILVMSTPDHDGRSENGITTLKEVKWLVAYQQQLAADCHVGWLNFFKAMGGNGATKRLVDQNMANKDYTHLSYGGGQVVAKRVYPSFKAGLNNYLRRKKLEQE